MMVKSIGGGWDDGQGSWPDQEGQGRRDFSQKTKNTVSDADSAVFLKT